MTSEYTYTNLDRARDAVANSDWEDIGHTDPYTIARGYAFFDRVIRQVKAEAWEEGAASGYDMGRGLGDDPNPYL